jgi:prophage tail gpP-like protein
MASRDSTLSLVIAGKRFGGWTDVRVSRGIERACGDFDISCTQRWPGSDARFEIEEGSKFELYIGDDKIITGYIDAIGVDRDADAAGCKITGRSKTSDLVDCSPNYKTGAEQAGLNLLAIAQNMAKPFDVDVVATSATGGLKALPVAAKHHGETVWKTIERMARQQKMMVMDDEQGRLVLTRLASMKSDDSLIYPSDGLKKISTKRDSAGRFSEYNVKAQAGVKWLGSFGTADGSDPAIPSALAHVEGVFYDKGVKRYRPKTITNEGAAKKEGALARAEWECRRNIGKALRISVTKVKWRQSTGALWKPNLLVPVKVPAANIDQELAIAEVHYIKNDSSGEICELELAPPDAFTPEPPETPGAGKGGAGRWSSMGNVLSRVE